MLLDASNQAIGFANVVLTNQKNEIIKGTITDESGRFSLSVKEGVYKLSISFLGYKDWLKEISINKSYDFGIIILKKDQNNLDEVVIKAEKRIIEKKVDRLVFNVSKSISIDGGNAIDALKYTPLLKVNNGELSLIGKSGLRVMVNDRIIKLSGDDLTDFLQSLPSENIDKIELITNPPAEYDADGNSGLVNIILKKNKNDSFSGFIRSTYQKSRYSKGYLGGGFNFQKDKISISLNVNSGLGSTGSSEKENIFYNQGITNINEDSKNKSKFFSSRLEFNYDVSPKIDVGFGYLSNYSNPIFLEENNSSSSNELTSTKGQYETDKEYHSLNVFLKSKLDTLGKVMKVDFDYLNYDSESEKSNKTSTNRASTNIIERFNSIQEINFFTVSADLALPYKFLNMSVGTKLSFIETNSGIKTFSKTDDDFIIDLSRTNDFKYNEDIQALYISFQKDLGKWSFKLGTRLELTQTKGTSISLTQGNTIIENNFSQLFPSAYVTYSPSEKNSYSVSYGKRVNRPNYSQLNPFRWYSNPFIYSEGNPFLSPYFIDNLEFSHLFKNNLNTTLYYSEINNGSDQITIVKNSSNLRYTIWENFVNSYSLGLTESYTLKGIASWLNSYLQFNINYSEINSSISEINSSITNTVDSQKGFNYYFQINSSFHVTSNKQLSGELNFWYSSSKVDGVYFLSDAYNLDLGLRYNSLSKRWLFSINFQDILNSNNLGLRSETNGISFNRQLEYDMQRIRFSIRYKFGNNKIKRKRVSFGNESERGRLD
ncbi:MAG: TonB-dependent receptor domain-containing protein [Tenacibaculum sp.]